MGLSLHISAMQHSGPVTTHKTVTPWKHPKRVPRESSVCLAKVASTASQLCPSDEEIGSDASAASILAAHGEIPHGSDLPGTTTSRRTTAAAANARRWFDQSNENVLRNAEDIVNGQPLSPDIAQLMLMIDSARRPAFLLEAQ